MSLAAPFHALAARPILLGALVAGLGAALVIAFLPVPVEPSIRPLVAWDFGAAIYIAGTWWSMRDDAPEDMARRAAKTDPLRHAVLALCTLAAAASVWAIAVECLNAKHAEGGAKGVHIAFVLLTVALSWLFTHTVFAAHYAHEYYGQDDADRTRGGLKFPGDDESPNWWDFLHFALVIGVAAQTADVQIESRAIRRTATWHGVAAFLFNTVILAFTVNLAAGLV